MVYLEIHPNTHHSIITQLNKHLSNAQAKTFALFFMDQCGPCELTRPEWSKLQNVLSKEIMDHPHIAIIMVNKDLVSRFPNVTDDMESFPAIRYMTDLGKTVEKYDDAILSKKDRSIDSFVEWIEKTMSTQQPKSRHQPKHRRKQSGGKQSGCKKKKKRQHNSIRKRSKHYSKRHRRRTYKVRN